MMTHQRLVELYRDLKDQPVLSVYMDVDQHDPAERDAWRRRLERAVAEVRRQAETAGNGHGVDAFDAAWARLRGELQSFDGFLPGRGWVGFATRDDVRYAEALPVPMPDLVRWEQGIRAAPYVRGLKQLRPVVVVLADRQRARLLIYRDGEIREPEDLRADTALGDLSDVNMGKRGARTTGIRGATSTDQAQRLLEVSSERMWKALGQRVSEYAGFNGYVVLGGTPETVSRLAGYLPESFSDRILERPSLHLAMTPAQVLEAAEQAARELTEARLEVSVDEVVDRARSGGRAVLGRQGTERALREMRVDLLLLSRGFIDAHPDFADRCVGTALAQDASVEEVPGEGAARLDAEGEGIGARLRYRLDVDGA